ncbi:MAG: hypothetical protein DRH26_01350 [Deltaproteobacteria bacterium]|nr:MAG: hypothetical protein DRH26_01350 [Deltaproteobacteria bacterium]
MTAKQLYELFNSMKKDFNKCESCGKKIIGRGWYIKHEGWEVTHIRLCDDCYNKQFAKSREI